MSSERNPTEGTSGRPGAARPARERRASLRHPARVRRAWVGWYEGREFRCLPAWLIDIGLGGMRLGVSQIPPQTGQILFRVDGALLPHWFEIRVLEVMAREAPGVFSLRAGFIGGCPYALFMAVAYGWASVEAGDRQPELPGLRPRPGRGADPHQGGPRTRPR